MPVFRLQFPLELVPAYAARYTDDDADVLAIGREVGDRGHYTLDEFRRVCRWRDPEERSARRTERARLSLEASTRLALADAVSDRERVKELQSLRGVGLPTASVLLHLVYPDRFPPRCPGSPRARSADVIEQLPALGALRRRESAVGQSGRGRRTHARPGSLAGRGSRVHSSDDLCSSARTLSRAGVLTQPCGFDRRDVLSYSCTMKRSWRPSVRRARRRPGTRPRS